jgi:hypothetical protein
MIISSLEEWLSFLKTGNIPENFTAPGLPEASERLREDSITDEERLRYRSYMESLRNARSMLNASYEDGEVKGDLHYRPNLAPIFTDKYLAVLNGSM